MSFTDPYERDSPYVQYRKIGAARKEWPCAYSKAGRRPECDGTIHPGEPYIDETVVAWAPEYDETGEDGYGRPTFGQVGVIGAFSHTRYHQECERLAIEYREYGTPEERAAEEAAETARAAKEKADRDAAEKAWRERRRQQQQHHSRKNRRLREIEAHATGGVRPYVVR